MEKELKEFMEKGIKLTDAWDNEKIKNYPKELPSFDELINLLSKIELKPEKRYKCKGCGKEFYPPRYYWEGLSGVFCSEECAVSHHDLPKLIKDEI